MNIPLEIERKFLIRMPDMQQLKSNSIESINISQTYLKNDETGASRRVRKSVYSDKVIFTYNEKKRLHGFTRSELESEISEEKYLEFLELHRTDCKTIDKMRYCIPHGSQLIEIDIYPFWQDRAILEIELRSEDETINLPDWVKLIKEVTDDSRYLNTSLSKSIIIEEI